MKRMVGRAVWSIRFLLSIVSISFVSIITVAGCGAEGGSQPGGDPDVPEDVAEVDTVFVPPDIVAPDITADAEDAGEDAQGTVCERDEDCEGAFAAGACAVSVCDLSTERCVLDLVPDGTACDDGNACTTASECVAGLCLGLEGARLECDDDNLCTDDACEPETGCVHEPNRALCDDGRVCTEEDRCADGVCVGAPLVCDDTNPCTDDVCREPTGCVHEPNAAPCDDGNACTANDFCAGGVCESGPPRSCDDGNPCTNDSCQSREGCRHRFNNQPCDDGNPCTDGDQCGDGVCHSGPYSPSCPTCDADYACRPYDDDNPCNGVIVCQEGQCRVLEVTVVTCEQPQDSCSVAGCDPATGTCVVEARADGTLCDDGDQCTLSDACAAGACVGAPTDCDDGNPCTVDTCAADGGCAYAPADDQPCDDGDPCTGGDRCDGAVCAPGPEFLCVACVTDDDCAAVDDDDLCNGQLRCADSVCRLDLATVVACDTSDDTDCRETRCEPTTGACVQSARPDGGACNDGSLCTSGDACLEGECVGMPTVCDDGDPCTEDLCDETTGGCVTLPWDGPCEDGDPCTEGDVCTGGVCIPGEPRDCDDDNPCTGDVCTPLQGCVYTPVSATCDDADACTLDDRCEEGECLGDPVNCDDGNPCTQDSCDAVLGTCAHSPQAGPCDDGDVCTDGDFCEAGVCVSGPPQVCDDGNPCTAGVCEPGEGCVYTSIEGGCDDQDACTTGDRCEDGVCVADGTLACDDTNPCTDDSCEPLVGCVYEPNTEPCDDEDACTESDVCVDGVCTAGAPVDCDDGDVCTDDTCLPASGCAHSFNTLPCDDGNPCTAPDACDAGVCLAGPIVCTEQVCDDGDDDDTDGLVDCDDPDCFDVSPCLPCEPVEELRCGATPSQPVRYLGTLMSPLATDNIDSYSCAEGHFGGREYGYRFEQECFQQMVEIWIDTTTAGEETPFVRLDAFVIQDPSEPGEDGRCDARSCFAHGESEQQTFRGHTEVQFPALYGNRYYVVVDGLDGDEGAYDLYVKCTPVPRYETCDNGIDDDCDGRIDCDDHECGTSPACP